MKKWLILFIVAPAILMAQSNRSSWQRQQVQGASLHLFHSPHVINLPTTEMLQKNNLEFEISHRFLPPVNEGQEAFWGLDGPVNMRLALAWAVTDQWLVAVGRSNARDNLDVRVKGQVLSLENKLPFQIGVQGGFAYNSQLFVDVEENSRKYQYYGQLIMNTMINKTIGIGVVPSFLHNANIYSPDVEQQVALGLAGQWYVNELLSLQIEWMGRISGYESEYSSLSYGFELETGGHFFKIFLTNNGLLNPTQFQAGADLPPDGDEWRLGFMITRLLRL